MKRSIRGTTSTTHSTGSSGDGPVGRAKRRRATRAGRADRSGPLSRVLAGWVTALLACASGAVGQQRSPEDHPRPTARALRVVEAAITLDGRLDEAVWSSAERLSDFVQSQPDAGAPATEPTHVRIVYDDDRLYIGVEAFDSEMDAMTVRSLERDFPGLSTRDGDILGVAIDTFLDRRNAFLFLINPFGAYRDGQAFDNSRNTDFGWDGEIEVRTERFVDRWTVELAIPWRTLRFDPSGGEQSWGLNFLRRVRRKNEDSYWAPLDRRDPVHRMAKAGTLDGLTALEGSGNFSVKPYLLAESPGGTLVAPEVDDVSGDVGFDLKYGVTPGLTLDVTYRTDFAQVEVDQERVNLTRFPLFFPEQRDFFLENSGSFTFGDLIERNYRMGTGLSDFTLFQSRRIGLEGGQPVPIFGGVRLSGTAGPTQVGLLNMQTESTDRTPAENFTVVRGRAKLGDGADVGAMFINRSPTDDGFAARDNTSWGIDANARVLGGLILNSYFAGTSTPESPEGEYAARLSVAWRSLRWNASAQYRDIGNHFDPGVGFVRRTGIRQSYATVGYHVRPNGIQEAAFYGAGTYVTDQADLMLTREGEVGIELDLLDGSRITGAVVDRTERLDEPFSIGGGIIPVGRYDFREGRASWQSNAGAAVSGRVTVTGGGFFNGDRRSVSASGRWQASYRLAVEVSAEYNRIELPDATFDANVFGARAKYAFSTSTFASAFVQYNDETRELVSNLRFNVIHAALSDLFLVYNERRDADSGDVLERLLSLKVTRYVAF